MGQVPMPTISPKRPPTQNQMKQVNNFQAQPNFKQPMQTNLGINGQAQSGGPSFGQTYGNIVKNGLNMAANVLIPGYSGYSAFKQNIPQQPPQNQPGAIRPPVASAAQPSNNSMSGYNPDPGAYTFSGGVNANGDVFPGFNTQNTTNNGFNNDTQSQPPQVPGLPVAGQPDRFAQIDALINGAGKYYQPTQDEQDTMTQLGNLATSRDLGLAKINNTPQPLELLTGQSDFLAKQAAAQAQPLTAKLGILQARRQAAIQGYQTALTGATAKLGLQQPVQVGMGSALIDPSTGRYVGGNADFNSINGGSSAGGGIIGNLAQQVLNGTSFEDAAAQLPSPYMRNALLSAVTAKNPNFNITQSNQQANASGAALNTAVTNATPLVNAQKTALDHISNIETILKRVNFSNIPLVNRARIFASNNITSDPDIRQLQSEINVVRGEVAKVLSGTGASTDAARAEAEQIVPDNISPDQFASVAEGIRELMQEKIAQYTNLNNTQFTYPGQSNQSGGSSSGGVSVNSWANF